MYIEADLLTGELVTVQILDDYRIDKELKLDDYFLKESYKKRLKDNSKRLDEESEIEKNIEKYADICNQYEHEYDFDGVNEDMLFDLEVYNEIYQMPILSITNYEWDLFFDTISDYYLEKGLKDFYGSDMIELNRMAIAKALVYKQESINLITYISALKYIESDILTISNIEEVIKRLEDTFHKENLIDYIRNKDGSLGNQGKEIQLYLIREESIGESHEEEVSGGSKRNNVINLSDVVGKTKVKK